MVTLNGKKIDFNKLIAPSRVIKIIIKELNLVVFYIFQFLLFFKQVSRQNSLEETNTGNKENVKDGRARIAPPPRYEEVGISGLPILVINILNIISNQF